MRVHHTCPEFTSSQFLRVYSSPMTVHLDPHSERLIEQQLRSGRYHSPAEVVARALDMLAERESTGADEGRRRQAVRDMLEPDQAINCATRLFVMCLPL